MPSLRHDGALMLVRERPTLVLDLLARTTSYVASEGVEVVIESSDFTQAVPLERRADLVFVLKRGGANESAWIVEVQLEIDHEKLFAWPLYAASLHAQVRCATQLVVLTTTARVAAWAREPIVTFSGFAPLVVGPDEIPRVADLETATRSPELAFLSALVHGNRRGGRDVVQTALRAADTLDAFRARHYVDLVFSAHPAVARAAMEVLMTTPRTEFKSEFMRKLNEEGRMEGALEGARRALFRVLASRGIEVSDAARARIEACKDAATIDRWVDRAVKAAVEGDLFLEE